MQRMRLLKRRELRALAAELQSKSASCIVKGKQRQAISNEHHETISHSQTGAPHGLYNEAMVKRSFERGLYPEGSFIWSGNSRELSHIFHYNKNSLCISTL